MKKRKKLSHAKQKSINRRELDSSAREPLQLRCPARGLGLSPLREACPACPQPSRVKISRLMLKQRRMLSAGRQRHLALCCPMDDRVIKGKKMEQR